MAKNNSGLIDGPVQDMNLQNSELMKIVVQHFGVHYWVYDVTNGTCVHSDESMADLGLPRLIENYPQKLIDIGYIHKDSHRDYLLLHEYVHKGVPNPSMEILVNEHGIPVWKRVKYTTLFDDKNKPVRGIGTSESIDSYKRAEKIYRYAARQSGLTYWMLDIASRTIYDFNNTALSNIYENITTIPNVPESTLAEGMLHPDDAAAYINMYDRIYAGAKTAKSLGRWKKPGGAVWWWNEISYTTVFDENGEPIKAIGSAADVTERVKLEQQYEEELRRREVQSRDVIGSFKMNLTRNTCGDGQGNDYELTTMQNATTVDSFFENDYRRCIEPNSLNEYMKIFNRENLISSFSQGITTLTHEHLFDFGNGKFGWILSQIVMVRNPKTHDVEGYISARDIDEKKTAQQLVDSIVQIDYDYMAMLDTKTSGYTLFAKTDSDTPLPPFYASSYSDEVEKYAREFLVEEDIEQNIIDMSIENITEQLATQKIFISYARVKEPDGRISHKKLKFSYLDEDCHRVIITRTDITDVTNQEKQKNEVLRSALLAAEQANSAKTEFLSRMSHEIRTPMNAIIGMSALAAQCVNDPKQVSDCLSKVGISARFLLSLINDILDMSRIESGKVLIKNEPIPFEEFIGGINAICYEQANQKGVEYDSIMTSFTEETYIGDAMKLQQILINIIANAIKFTPVGGKVQFIVHQEKIKRNEAVLKFTVNDTGVGIGEKFIPHLFTPFEQEHAGSTSIYGGTGLGLAICKNLVSLMDGKISVNSIEGVGSEFIVEVKLGISEESKKAVKAKANLCFDKLHALIVDDDVLICRHTEQILSDLGMRAEWVDSGRKAIDLVQEKWNKNEYYDVILVDWKMPDMDGIETARHIRQTVGPDVTIIIITAYDWTVIEAEARSAGVNLLISKPLFKSSLCSAFEQIYNKKAADVVPAVPASYNFTGKRILLVEDHVLNVEVARRLLESKNAVVEVAENGLLAIETFAVKEAGYFDAILMDVRMPVMDGLTAARSIRQMRKSDAKTIPIIAMTANAFEEDVEQTKAAGMNAHLAKPIEPQLLYQTIHQFLTEEA